MNAPAALQLVAAEPDFGATVYSWRGACLELFSRAEAHVANCLEAMQSAGMELHNESRHAGAVARFRALGLALDVDDFEGHSKIASKRISEWIALWDERLWLAHGRFRIGDAAVVVSLTAYARGEPVPHAPRVYTSFDMLRIVATLETSVRLLHGQLGQINAVCRKRADLAPI